MTDLKGHSALHNEESLASAAVAVPAVSRLVKLILEYDGTYFQGWQSQNPQGAGEHSLSPQEEADAVARMRQMGTKRKPGECARTV